MPFDFHLDLAQMIGIVASATIIFAFNMKSDNRFKVIAAFGNLIFAVHFFMLGAYAGAATNILNAVRGTLSIKFHRSNKMMIFFIVLYVAFAIVLTRQVVDLLPFLTGVIGCFALYKLSGIPMRLIMLISSCMWMTYNIMFMSIGGIITECFVMSANCLTIYRIFRDNEKANETSS